MGPWLRPGRILNDRYKLEEMLGSGGMGSVVAATDLRTGGRVALKVPHRERMQRPRDVERFGREARLAAQVASPHVAKIVETGLVRDGERALPFIALEYLDGADLATWLGARGPLKVATAAAIVVQACHAIADAHVRGIVHRDLKPANLMLTRVPSGAVVVKVLDFGISRADDAERITTGPLLGSLAYMPPEQLRPSATADARGDLWALGVVLFEAVTGRLPFSSPGFPDLCMQILLDDPPPLGPDVPAAFADVVRRCLEKEPADRFQTAGELRAALVPFAEPTLQISVDDLELLVVEPAGGEARAAAPMAKRRASIGLWAAVVVAIAMSPGARAPIGRAVAPGTSPASAAMPLPPIGGTSPAHGIRESAPVTAPVLAGSFEQAAEPVREPTARRPPSARAVLAAKPRASSAAVDPLASPF